MADHLSGRTYIGVNNGTTKIARQIYIGNSRGAPQRLKSLWIGDFNGVPHRIYISEIKLTNLLPIINNSSTSYGWHHGTSPLMSVVAGKRYLIRNFWHVYASGNGSEPWFTPGYEVNGDCIFQYQQTGGGGWENIGGTQCVVRSIKLGESQTPVSQVIFVPSVNGNIQWTWSATGTNATCPNENWSTNTSIGWSAVVDITELENYLGKQFPNASAAADYLGRPTNGVTWTLFS